MKTLDFIKWYKPIIALTLLHLGIMLYCFYNNISTMLYSTILIFFLGLMIMELIRVNKANRIPVFAPILLALSALYFLFFNQIESIYLNYTFGFVCVLLILFGGIQMIRNNPKTTASEKNTYTLLLCFIVVNLALTVVLNMLGYKNVLLLEMQEKYPQTFLNL